METTERKGHSPCRQVSPEFEAEVVALVHHGAETLGAIARELDLTETAVRAWVKRAEIDAATRSDG